MNCLTITQFCPFSRQWGNMIYPTMTIGKYLLASLFLLGLLIPTTTQAQEHLWIWRELAPMPEAVSNNAVVEAFVDGKPYVYSFSGIDETKIYSGIHQRAYRYDVETDEWTMLAPLPDDKGRIAAGASVIKGKIYIAGGYEVRASGTERSFDQLFVFDPESNTYLEDANPMPVAIDDQVQAVWRDSLLYLITGWSDFTNVSNVQIYNPSTDTWMEGTPVPDTPDYKVFGGSGTIVGDTIYYIGGTKIEETTLVFTLGDQLRKGYIHPDDPSQIDWETETHPLALGYRMAATTIFDQPIWIGGSDIAYNFDGIGYNRSGGAEPLNRIITYKAETGQLIKEEQVILPTMDLRGVAKISQNEYIIAGGMGANQEVSKRVFKLTWWHPDLVAVDHHLQSPSLTLYPNPASNFVEMTIPTNGTLIMVNAQGQVIGQQSVLQGKERISIRDLKQGMYGIVLVQGNRLVALTKLIVSH